MLTVAQATPVRARPSACAGVKALKSVFPQAGKVGFDSRSSAKPGVDMRINGMCGGWYSAYGYRPHDTRGVPESPSVSSGRGQPLSHISPRSVTRHCHPKVSAWQTEVFPETDVHGVVHEIGKCSSQSFDGSSFRRGGGASRLPIAGARPCAHKCEFIAALNRRLCLRRAEESARSAESAPPPRGAAQASNEAEDRSSFAGGRR